MTANCLLDLKEPGQTFEGYALVIDVQAATAKNNKPYINLVLGKKEKKLRSKLWDNNFNGYELQELVNEVFIQGTIVYIKGDVGKFNEELQLSINKFSRVESDEIEYSDFIPLAPEPKDKLVKEFENFLEDIENPIIKRVCQNIYNDYNEKFTSYPAAKFNHHAFGSGLLYHTVSMLRMAKHIATQYTNINRDLLYAGVALHDFGKVYALSEGPVSDYTRSGNLLGHITLTNMLIYKTVEKIKKERKKVNRKTDLTKKERQLVSELMHIISAHHGKLEYGSPVKPQTLEAEIVHHIDMIDTRINMINMGLIDDDISKDQAKKIPPLGYFYKSSDNSAESNLE
ncbi:3'-5' exoribonuclease YhaM family protein [Natranaerofaba carboxydovora]|uniref:3'-5' exoribonuclease YhaM family protein n=1 Tax=Natranaerofaba carboxydovora TaxID=2742683 RepID=UPI001F137A61|nr:HD domain-containing protein [Natranaerofaba carboxydovora]UMZ73559.1 3'-5' exoribonuclease YhaM [Natranaerofaba carboxydovora]